MTPNSKVTPRTRTSWHRTTTTYKKANLCRSKPGKTARSGRQGCKGHTRRGKLRPGRDLHEPGPARPRVRSHCFPRQQNGWCTFFAVRSSHNSRLCRIPMPASPRHRARCNRHEARSGIIAFVSSYGSAMEAWVLLMRLSHCQRARSEVFAVVALQRAAWTRWLSVVVSKAASKLCSQLCSTEHTCQTQNLSIFHATQSTGPTDASLGRRISFPIRAVIVPVKTGFPLP